MLLSSLRYRVLILIMFCVLGYASHAQEKNTGQVQSAKTLYEKLARGWNTWDVRSVLSHITLPSAYGVTLQLISKQHNDTLKEAFIAAEEFGKKEHVVPVHHAYDGSYTELLLEWKGIRIRVQTAAKNNRWYLLVTPDQSGPGDSMLIIPRMFWGRPGDITITGNSMLANTKAGTTQLYLIQGNYTAGKRNFTASLKNAAALSTDPSVSAAELKQIMDAAQEKAVAEKKKYQSYAELYNGIQASLSWNTLYDPYNNRVLTPVSRNWALNSGWVLFGWDNYFVSCMFALDHKELAYANAIAITQEITKRGFIPNNSAPEHKSEDRTEPQVGSIMVREIYRKYPEKWFLREVYNNLLSWNRWRADNRDIDGYLVHGTDPYDYGNNKSRSATESGKMKAAKWESGMDNSPMWDDAVFDSVHHRMLLADVGLMSLYIADCHSLAEIAAILGKTADTKELTERADKYAKKLAGLWNEQFGLYLNKDLVTGKPSYRLSPTLFYPLLAKVATQQQAERMMKEHFYNPDEFWGDYIMPSISRNDKAYKDNHYWRGRIWAPLNFLVYLGMRNYRIPQARKDMVDKSRNLFMKSWTSKNYVGENYNADTGECGEPKVWSDGFYHWGSLLGFMDFMERGVMSSSPQTVKK
jgi:putative isomerase